jgi:hypothetical protein
MFKVNLTNILIVAVIFGIVVAYATYRMFRLKLIAAFTLGLIVAYGLLNVMYPIGYLMYQKDSLVIGIYILIEIIVPIYIFLYLFYLLITNQRRED